MIRIGFSEDIHQKAKGRKLILGGVEFPNEDGLMGHSDADVVTHAVAESILGALALGDLGTHFPDNDPATEGISSMVILDKAVEFMIKQGYKIGNIDIQVSCKSPKLASNIQFMRMVIADHLKTEVENVSIKACSFNGVGPIGEGKAIKAQSYVLLEK